MSVDPPGAGDAAAADVGLEEQAQRLLHRGRGVPGGPVVTVQGAVQQSVPERCGVRVFAEDFDRFDRRCGIGDPAEDVVERAAGQRRRMQIRLDHLRRFSRVEPGRVIGLTAGRRRLSRCRR